MNREYYENQIAMFKSYKAELLVAIEEVEKSIEQDNFQLGGYDKALKTLSNLQQKLDDLNFNIEWFTKKLN